MILPRRSMLMIPCEADSSKARTMASLLKRLSGFFMPAGSEIFIRKAPQDTQLSYCPTLLAEKANTGGSPLSSRAQPRLHRPGDQLRGILLHPMAGVRDRYQRQVLLQPFPGIVQRSWKQSSVLETVKHQDRRLHLHERPRLIHIRLARIVGLVIVEHGLDIRPLEGLDVFRPGIGIRDEPRKQLGSQLGSRAGLLEVSRILAVLLLFRIARQFADQS